MHEYGTELKIVLDQLAAAHQATLELPALKAQVANLTANLATVSAEFAKRLPVDEEDAVQLSRLKDAAAPFATTPIIESPIEPLKLENP